MWSASIWELQRSARPVGSPHADQEAQRLHGPSRHRPVRAFGAVTGIGQACAHRQRPGAWRPAWCLFVCLEAGRGAKCGVASSGRRPRAAPAKPIAKKPSAPARQLPATPTHRRQGPRRCQSGGHAAHDVAVSDKGLVAWNPPAAAAVQLLAPVRPSPVFERGLCAWPLRTMGLRRMTCGKRWGMQCRWFIPCCSVGREAPRRSAGWGSARDTAAPST